MPELPVNQIVQGDCLEVMRSWPDGCVDMCVTSPPYWSLRNYGVDGQFGLEKTPAEYVANMVEVFREVRRVLADHGVLFLNLGDCYYRGNKGNSGELTYSDKQASNRGSHGTRISANLAPNRKPIDGLKAKDLVGIPWMLAFALRDDGWYLRSDIIEEVEIYCPCGCGYILEERIWRWSQDRDLIWKKPNPMPESCRDRPTKAHEYVFLLSKKPRYYYDAEAIKEDGATEPHAPGNRLIATEKTDRGHLEDRIWGNGTRNRRTVWTIPTQPMPEAHFATYPEALVEPCILAGCPKEVCRVCGKPRERIVEKSKTFQSGSGKSGKPIIGKQDLSASESNSTPDIRMGPCVESMTLGWTDCGHDDYRTGIVLDPFGGSGTTGVVAGRLKRDYILIELNAKYVDEIAKPRLNHIECGVPVEEQRAGQMGLFQE